jgi:4-hydroxy-tetrahydrodipicolinate reductase
VGVHGATGRMGRLVCAEVESAPDLALAWAAARTLPESLAADVIVDFSVPDALRRLLAVARCPVVSGTTGLTLDTVGVPVVHAANYSLGVAVLARLVRAARSALPAWDAEIVEVHHAAKRDAPSGTALRLAEGLGTVTNGHAGLRVAGEVGLHAVRGGDVVGEHTVHLFGAGERLTLGHVATDRRLFAVGALTAARWIIGKPVGLYGMDDVVG